MADFVTTDKHDDGVVVLRIDRAPVNALNVAVAEELLGSARELSMDPGVKAVVVTGGEKVFAAGADISEIGTGEVKGGSAEMDARHVGAVLRTSFDALAAIPRPVIAAIAGYALGGGLELALAADLRIAATTARLGLPEILLGIFPGAGATQRLPRLVGMAKAKEMVWTGRHLRTDEALAVGLVDRVVPAGSLLEAATAWASELAQGAVVAMGLAKRAMDSGIELPLQRGLDLEAEVFLEALATEDAATGLRSFLEHGPGKARFVGR